MNADLAAGAIASALSADLLLLTDVPSVRDGDGRALSTLSPTEAQRLIARSVAQGGMIPKLDAALRSLAAGARSAWIGDLDGLSAAGPSGDAGTRIVRAGGAKVPASAAPPVPGAS